MSVPQNLPSLEAALLDRAERRAAEYVARGEEGRKSVIKEEELRLAEREKRISEAAQASSERLYRRRVQAAQLRLQGELDRLRWSLVAAVVDELPERLASLAEDEEPYETLLGSLLARAAENIPDAELVAAVSPPDHSRLQDRWRTFSEAAVPGKTVTLDPIPRECVGGIQVTNRDDNVRIDATFEGRIGQFQDELKQVIAEHLFLQEGSGVKK